MASVLVVDDDVDVLDALCAALATMGHAIERASSGLQALAVLDRVRDVVMPGLHGFNLARMAILRRPDLRVLYFTGNAEMEVVQKDAGPKNGRMLHKPLRPDELRREIEEALSAPRPS